MELAEVVSPNVAVPVIVVLLCAVLVFAFGFKSSVQPPSFDFYDDDKKHRRNRKTKGKGQSNGHVVTLPESEDSDSKPQSKQAAKTPTSPATKQPVVTSKAAKPEPKKVKKPGMSPPAPREVPAPVVEEADDEGWTQNIKKNTKKAKKLQKSKREGYDYGGEERGPGMDAETDPAVQDEDEAPQEQRSRKTAKKPAAAPEPASSEEQAESTPVEAVEPPEAVAMTTEASASPTTSKKAKNKKEKKPAADKSEPTEDQVVQSELSPERVNQSEVLPQDPVIQSDISLETLKAEASHSEPAKGASAAPDSRPARSPKKKRKAKPVPDAGAGDDTASPPESPVIESSPITEEPGSSQDAQDSLQKDIDIPQKTHIDDDVVNEAGDASAAKVDQPEGAQATVFDEMGESWTVAKPKIKKKKARRDN